MMKYKEIVCDYCHKKAVVPTLRKANYCDDCKAKAHTENVKASKRKNEEQYIQIYDPTEYMYIKEIQEILERYGCLRKDVIYLWSKIKKLAEYYTKSGDMLLHKIEIGGLTQQQTLNLAKGVEIDRRKRRGCKDSALILFHVMCSLGLRDPVKFGEVAINGAKTQKDFNEFLEMQKYDKSIYSNALRKEGEIDE